MKEYNAGAPHKAIEVTTTHPVPERKEDELLIRITCRPVNPADILQCSGYYPRLHPELPTTPGIEGVGVVEEASPSETEFPDGSRVIGSPFPLEKKFGGTWQEYLTVKRDTVVKVPKELDDEVASQIQVNPLTAYGFFDVLQIPEGEYLLQAAASGVLGRQVIQMAKHYGIKSINIIRSDKHRQELLDLGADEVIVSDGESGEDIVQRVQDITSARGAYGTIDPIGGQTTAKLLTATRARGTVLIYGALSGLSFTGGIPDILFQLKTVTGFHIAEWQPDVGKEKAKKAVEEVLDMLVKGVLTPNNGSSFPLHEAAEAIQAAAQPGRGGKVFLKS